MKLLKPCPWCGREEKVVKFLGLRFWVKCKKPKCGANGPIGKTEIEAAGKWNEVSKNAR